MNILHNKYARIVTVLLLVQGLIFYSVALRAETTPTPPPLASLSRSARADGRHTRTSRSNRRYSTY